MFPEAKVQTPGLQERATVKVPRTGKGSALLLALIAAQDTTPDNLTHLARSLGVTDRGARKWRDQLVGDGLVVREGGFLHLGIEALPLFQTFDYLPVSILRSPDYTPRLKLAMGVVFGEAVGKNPGREWIRSDEDRARLADVSRATVVKARQQLVKLDLISVKLVPRRLPGGRKYLRRAKLAKGAVRRVRMLGRKRAAVLADRARVGRQNEGTRLTAGGGTRCTTHDYSLRSILTRTDPDPEPVGSGVDGVVPTVSPDVPASEPERVPQPEPGRERGQGIRKVGDLLPAYLKPRPVKKAPAATDEDKAARLTLENLLSDRGRVHGFLASERVGTVRKVEELLTAARFYDKNPVRRRSWAEWLCHGRVLGRSAPREVLEVIRLAVEDEGVRKVGGVLETRLLELLEAAKSEKLVGAGSARRAV